MKSPCLSWITCALVVAASSPLVAQPAEPAEPEAEPAPEAEATPDLAVDADAALLEPLEGEPEPDDPAAELTGRIEELEARLAASEQARRERFPVKVSGHGDLGFSTTQGDGSGLRRDVGHMLFPEHADIGWVFYGDLLSTQINSRGDVADLGEVPGVLRFDSVDSEGNPTFLVNELNLSVQAGLGPRALFSSSVNFTPRTGTDFDLGDALDIDLVQLEWLATADGKTSVFVGKVDSVIGIEYRSRKASQRFGITPSLLARYTTGTAVGVKARTVLAGDHVVLAAAVTNGSFGTEQFHFFSEVDTNAFKTVSGRAALRFAVGDGAVEVGGSGQWGVQDGAGDGAGAMWFAGVDAELALTRFAVRAQWLKGAAPGDEFAMAYSLDLNQGAYLEAHGLITPRLGVLGRAELRDARVQEGQERLYITRNWKATAGLRLILGPHAVVKAEYSHNGEYGGTPAIPDDVVTSSAVIAF